MGKGGKERWENEPEGRNLSGFERFKRRHPDAAEYMEQKNEFWSRHGITADRKRNMGMIVDVAAQAVQRNFGVRYVVALTAFGNLMEETEEKRTIELLEERQRRWERVEIRIDDFIRRTLG